MGKTDDNMKTPEVKVHLWIEKNEGVFFGYGRYQLLYYIEELGSLRVASEKLGISYRGAWGKIKKTEEIIGQKIIYKENNKEGYKLTDFGRKFMLEFKRFFDDVSSYAHERSSEMLKKIYE